LNIVGHKPLPDEEVDKPRLPKGDK